MTRDELVSVFRLRAGFNNALSEAVILQFFDIAQAIYEVPEEGVFPLPWFLFESADVTLLEGESNVALPGTLLAVDDDWPPRVSVAGGLVKLPRIAPDRMPAVVESGTPGCQVIAGGVMYVDAIADQDYDITVWGYYESGKLSETADSPWFKNAGRLILEEALVQYGVSTGFERVLQGSQLGVAQQQYLAQIEGQKHRLIQYVRGNRG